MEFYLAVCNIQLFNVCIQLYMYVVFLQNVIPVQAVKPLQPQYASNVESTKRRASNESTENVKVCNYVCMDKPDLLCCTITILIGYIDRYENRFKYKSAQ